MMHTLWGVILFDGLHRNSMVSVIWVVGSHFAASFGTTLIPSSSVSGGCYFSFAINFGVLAGSCGLAFLPLRAAAAGR
ncbi:hypothetical protein DFJ73DRAFT_508657 [Zopfochytrium polystomum]|nr:hypothetical protein DFJ73DRAFT_508657 [Zopfochytrium polystomum]